MIDKGCIALALSCAATLACAQATELAATVNGAAITLAKLDAQVRMIVAQRDVDEPEAVERLRREVLEQLITQELLWQAAETRDYVAEDAAVDERLREAKLGFQSEEAFRAQLEAGNFSEETFRIDLRHRLSVQRLIAEDIAGRISISDEEIEAFYADNPQAMQLPEEIRASHILIQVEGDGEAVEAAARETIDSILADARSGAAFAALAREHSDGPTASQGGDLGFFGRGQMVAPFERAAFALRPGEISDVVRTQFGFHIIMLEARRGGEQVTKEEVAESIAEHLKQQRMQGDLETLVQELRSRSEVIYLLL